MRKITKGVLNTLLEDERTKKCCLAEHIPHVCSPKIEFHHNLIYAGRQVNLANAILPLCSNAHKIADRKDVKEVLDWIMLNLMTDREVRSFSKAPLVYKRGRLNVKYGEIKRK